MAKLSEDDVADVRLAQAGDAAAYGRLYERHHKYIKGVCNRGCRDREIAEDLSQNVWLKAVAKLSQLKEPEVFLNWLHGGAINELKMWWRGNKRNPPMESLDEPSPLSKGAGGAHETVGDFIPAASTSLEGTNDRLALEQALDCLLSNAQRTVFVLHFIMGLDLLVVVRLTGWSREKVKALSFRAQRQVRGMLGRGGE